MLYLSHMKRKNMKLSVLPICLLFIVGLTFSSFGDILCVSDSGHIKVESICNPCCDETANPCFLNKTDFGHEHHDSCDNCSDLSLESPKILDRLSNSDFGLVNFSSNSLHLFSVNNDLTISSQRYRNKELSYTISKEVDILISTTVIIC